MLNIFRKQEVRHRLRWIPAGSFDMGSPETEQGRSDGEVLHHVTLTQGYWLGETTVTQALWTAVMGKNPSYHQGDKLPVETVSWDDCQQFIKKLSAQLPGLQFRLPTEAEWEYACRAGTQTAYWWGNQINARYANSNFSTTKFESNYSMNDFGLRSMSGNVMEWCHDWYGHYSEQAMINPIGLETGQRRVLRGGGWIVGASFLRAARRNANRPNSHRRDFGLRLAGGFDPQAGSVR